MQVQKWIFSYALPNHKPESERERERGGDNERKRERTREHNAQKITVFG